MHGDQWAELKNLKLCAAHVKYSWPLLCVQTLAHEVVACMHVAFSTHVRSCTCTCLWQCRRRVLTCYAERKARVGLHIILAWRKSEAKISFGVTGWLGTLCCAIWPVLSTDGLAFRETLTEWEVIIACWANCALKWIDGDQKSLCVLLSIQQYNHTNWRAGPKVSKMGLWSDGITDQLATLPSFCYTIFNTQSQAAWEALSN